MIFALSRTNFDILSLVCLPAVFLSARAERKQRHARGGRFRISPPSGLPSFKRPKGARPFWISPCKRPARKRDQILWLRLRFAQNDEKWMHLLYHGRAITLPWYVVLKRFVLLELVQRKWRSPEIRTAPVLTNHSSSDHESNIFDSFK